METAAIDEQLALAQALRYAEELQELWQGEREQRMRAEETLAELELSYATTVRALASAVELRDDATGGHAERVTTLGLELAREVAPALAESRELEYGFQLHDLGKIGIPDAILLKPGPLTETEREVMQQHPLLGERIVARIPYLGGVARDVIVAHHEWWDGSGYPRGLRGEEIPLAARIFSVVDAFDAMTHDRPYRQALSTTRALAEIESLAGRQFDPAICGPFAALAGRLRGVAGLAAT